MVQIQKLSNNIPVIYEHIAGMRSTAFGIFVKMGSAAESKEENGISHVIEHMLFKGTDRHNARQLADIMSDVGSNINAYTAKEVTAFYGRVLNEDIECSVDILSEMLTASSFNEKELSKEKHVILDEIDLYEDSAEDLCHELLQKKIWKDSPYGYIISGTKTNVRSFTREKIISVWKNSYTADNMVISVAGGLDKASVMNIFEQKFGSISKTGHETFFPVPQYNKVFMSRYKDTEQVHMNIAFDNVSSKDNDRFPMSIISAALGGNLNSKLFQKVREEMGLTYSIYSYSSMLNTAGLFHIYASMNPGQAVKVLKAVYSVIDDFRQNGISKDELATLKKQMRTELILSGESASARMNSNAKSYMILGRTEEMDETIDKVNAVSEETINNCIHKYLNIDNCSMSVVGDTKHIDITQLKKTWKQNI